MFSTAAELVPTLTTDADDPAAPVETVPTETVADAPAGPAEPAGPVEPAGPWLPAEPAGPAGPVSPRGIVKFRTAADELPPLTTDAELPAAPVVTLPTVIVADVPSAPAAPGEPAEPAAPWGPAGPAGPRTGPMFVQAVPSH